MDFELTQFLNIIRRELHFDYINLQNYSKIYSFPRYWVIIDCDFTSMEHKIFYIISWREYKICTSEFKW